MGAAIIIRTTVVSRHADHIQPETLDRKTVKSKRRTLPLRKWRKGKLGDFEMVSEKKINFFLLTVPLDLIFMAICFFRSFYFFCRSSYFFLPAICNNINTISSRLFTQKSVSLKFLSWNVDSDMVVFEQKRNHRFFSSHHQPKKKKPTCF